MVGLFFNRKSKSDRDATGPTPDFEATAPTLYDPRLAAFEDTTPDALPGVPDLYLIIGVDPRASDDTIRYAYRRRAARLLDARWRPGRAARRLSELNAAYEILGKPDRRADYDRQRMRQAAYERARIAATRVDPFQTVAYSSVRSTPDEAASRFEADDESPDGAYRDGVIEPAAPFRDAAYHDSPTPVGIDGAAAVAKPAQPARSALRRGVRLARPTGLRDVLVLALVAALLLALVAGLVALALTLNVSLWAQGGQGISFNALRAAPTATVPPAPTPTPRPVLVQQPTAPTSTPVQPTATLPAKPTVAAKPSAASPPGAGAIGTQVRITDQNPPRRSDVGVTVRVTRDGRALPNVPVVLRVYYRTVEERWPPDNQSVLTNASGEATIVFNVGDATPGYEAQVVAIVDVNGEPFQMQTSFMPR